MKWLSFTHVTQRDPTNNSTTLKEIFVEIIKEITEDSDGRRQKRGGHVDKTTSVNVNTEGNTFSTEW
jgi:hypothetical protein